MSPASVSAYILALCSPSVYDFVLKLRDQKIPVPGNPDYSALLQSLCRRLRLPDFDQKVAFVAINPDHEGQQKFCSYLKDPLGFVVDQTDFRDAFVIPGRENPYQRLSSRMTYLLGLLAHKRAHFVMVTDAFDVYYPLLDYVKNRGGKATIAFFRGGMEDRWQRVGLFDTDSPIRFIDLSDDAKAILGADLGSSLSRGFGQGGLSELRVD